MTTPKLNQRFFISDLHIAHDKLAEIRGYKDANHFWNELKQAWNDTIREEQVVYILGDVVMRKKEIPLLNELKGSKRIVLGNHDLWPKELDKLPKTKVSAMVVAPKNKMILTHIPIHPSFFSFNKKDWRNVHGHMHEYTLDDKSRYCSVCVEQAGLTPKPFDWLEDCLSMEG